MPTLELLPRPDASTELAVGEGNQLFVAEQRLVADVPDQIWVIQDALQNLRSSRKAGGVTCS
jgi:hypothetical protein